MRQKLNKVHLPQYVGYKTFPFVIFLDYTLDLQIYFIYQVITIFEVKN